MPSSTGFTSHTLVLARGVVLWMIIATVVPGDCLGSGGRRNDVVYSFLYPSFMVPGDALKFSWDAGVLDGAIHLTTDNIYQPPVQYPPDAKRSAGRVFLWAGGPEYRSYYYSRAEAERNKYSNYYNFRGGPYSFRYYSGRSSGPEPEYDYYYSDELSEFLSHEASFNTSFSMSVSRSPAGQRDDGGLLLEVMPYVRDGFDRARYQPLASTTTSCNVSVEIGTLDYYYEQSTRGVYVSVAPASASNHTVWVGYDAVGHNLSVYVDGQATLHALLHIDDIVGRSHFYKYFGLFASKNRTLPSCQPVIYSWNVTVDKFIPTQENTGHHEGEQHDDRRSWILAIILSLVLVAAGAAIILVAWMWTRMASWYKALVMKLKLSRALRRLPGMPREFKFADVKKATRNFHDSNRLGSGGFGAVYKGTMVTTATSDGGKEGRRRRHRQRRYAEVAVKKFTRKEEDRGYDDFLAEVAIINRLRHRNIVPLLGWCYENGELLLIYQYMPNGSLDQHLFCNDRPTLRWATRYQVAADVAAALHYVHHEYERVVLHRDIKASNVMLDANFNGRLGDFGLAGLVDDDKNSLSDLPVAGTWGFIAPEYPVSHRATRKTDVYAFGVLVLELVTGKRSLGEAGTEFQLLTDWVWWLHGEGRLMEAVDDEVTAAREVHPDVSTRLLESVDLGTTSAGGEFDAADAIRLLLLGLACTNPNPLDRPTTADLVQVIAKRVAPPVVPPVKPTFVWPLEGDLPLLDDDLDLDEDFGDMSDDQADHSHSRSTLSREGLALSIGSLSLEIMVCRSRR